jgi:hypothetical protein
MVSQPATNFDAIIAMERSDLERLRGLSIKERAALIEAACDSAVEIEMSRRRMGLSESSPAPWPASTWKYLAQWSRSAREAR